MVSGLTASSRHHGVFHELARIARESRGSAQQAGAEVEALQAEEDKVVAEEDTTASQLKTAEQFVSALQDVDRDVKAHEAAHMAAGGSAITGGASYTYETGPDGQRYAVGGEVGVDLSAVPGNPRATIAKMALIQAAALAPSVPSPQDLAVAAAAARVEAQAQADLEKMAMAGATAQTVSGRYADRTGLLGTQVNAVA